MKSPTVRRRVRATAASPFSRGWLPRRQPVGSSPLQPGPQHAVAGDHGRRRVVAGKAHCFGARPCMARTHRHGPPARLRPEVRRQLSTHPSRLDRRRWRNPQQEVECVRLHVIVRAVRSIHLADGLAEGGAHRRLTTRGGSRPRLSACRASESARRGGERQGSISRPLTFEQASGGDGGMSPSRRHTMLCYSG
jgi:hypothetical protein